jgi:hypothetical protein
MRKFFVLSVLIVASHFATAADTLPQVAAPPAASNTFQPSVAGQPQPLPGDLGPPGAAQAQITAQAQAEAARISAQQQAQAAYIQQQQQAAIARLKAKKTDNAQAMQALQQFFQGLNPNSNGLRNGEGIDGNPRTYFGDDGPQNKDGTYSDSQRYYYGGKGVGNIGNGLCTSKNANRSQMKLGYCQMLRDELNREGSCAKRSLDAIMAMAYPDGRGVQGLNSYCPNFSQLGDNRREVFVQVLASLIVQESGWRTGAVEGEWYKNGQPMGGHGLFQIGVNDRGRYSGCSRINSSSIYDPKVNIECGSCIALELIAKDSIMGAGASDHSSRGMARYFGPSRDGQAHKRAAMQNAVSEYCRGNLGASVGTEAAKGSKSTSAEGVR